MTSGDVFNNGGRGRRPPGVCFGHSNDVGTKFVGRFEDGREVLPGIAM